MAALVGQSAISDSGRVTTLERENEQLKELLQKHGIALPNSNTTSKPIAPAASACQQSLTPAESPTPHHVSEAACPRRSTLLSCNHSLTKEQVERYSRQLLLPSFGLRAQEGVCHGSVLIVGCGGLGSPAAMYLAAAGVGRIGLVDHDTVDVSNLHRQVIHSQSRVGQHKALSAASTCHDLNPLVVVETHTEGLNRENALELVGRYDVVLDASDNPPTRYLISDACVVADKPLVSAAAVGTDGQLTVYNSGPDGPCYRCLFPESPAPENCSRCADAGVLGPVPGVMGVLQAIEVIKILGHVGDVLTRKLLIYDALSGRFTTVKLRGKRPECVACGTQPVITIQTLSKYDYVTFTGQAATDGPLPPISLIPDRDRLTVHQLKELLQPSSSGNKVALLDVRPVSQTDLFCFPGALHIPFEQLEQRMDEIGSVLEPIGTAIAPETAADGVAGGDGGQVEVGSGRAKLVVLCRRGNNSQRAAVLLRGLGMQGVVDVIGGVDAWVKEVEQELPRI